MSLSSLSPSTETTSDTHQHQQSVNSSGTSYVVSVGGTADGESMRDPVGYGNYGQDWENNLWARMENTGDEPVVNPWIVVDGNGPWRTREEILAHVLDEGMSQADKARAIWEFARHHRYHFTTGDDEVKDTVKMLNVYGYTLCWDEAYTVANLWQAAGLKIRRGLPHGHCTTEVWYDGAYHLLDSDEHLLVLDRDNETVIGESEISHDHDLMKRSHAYGVLSPEDRARSESAASLFCHTGSRAGSRPLLGDHRMDLTLRPGEALTWGWESRGRWRGLGDAPKRYCNGELQWSVPLGAGFERWTEAVDNVVGSGDALSVGEHGSLTWRLAAPYAIVGGRVTVEVATGAAQLQLSRTAGEWIDVADGIEGCADIDLDEHFPPASAASYGCCVRLSGSDLTLREVAFQLDLQMAPLALPALRVGDNTVAYVDASASRQVSLTHAWRERYDLEPPDAPEPRAPVDGEPALGTTPTLRWSDTAGEGGDYHLRLGGDPSLRWVLSPVFEKLVSRTPSKGRCEWTVPQPGLLNPDTDYFWQVRARTPDGLWGPWSRTSRLQVQAPGVPQAVRFELDGEARRGILRWQPASSGTPPVRYEIYGSDERGFSACAEAHVIVVGETEPDGKRSVPSNLLTTVEAPQVTVDVGGAGVEVGNCAFYRVVAVDGDGQRGGPSEYAEAIRPFVFSSLPQRVPAEQVTEWPLASVRSIGDLRSESRGQQRYHAAFRDADELEWILDEGPSFVALDAASGVLTFRPEARHASTHTVTVRVKNGQGGVDVVGFDLEVFA